MNLFQYQGSAVPLGSPAPERATPDKWMPEHFYPRPNYRPNYAAVAASQANYYLAYAEAPPFGEAPNPAKFYTQPPEPKFDLVRKQFIYPSIDAGKIGRRELFPGDWAPVPNQPLFDVKRFQFTYPSTFFSQIQFNEVVYGDKWQPEMTLPFHAKQPCTYHEPAFVAYKSAGATSWFVTPNQPLFAMAKNQFLFQTSVDPNRVVEIINADKWSPLPNLPRFDVARIQALYPNLTFDPRPFPSPVFADTWHPDSNKPLFDLKRMQYVYPFKQDGPVSTTFVEQTSVDRWYQEAEIPQRKNANVYAFPFLTEIPFRSAVLVIASWLSDASLLRFAKQTRISTEVSYVAVLTTATPNGWFGQTETPIRLRRTNADVSQANAITQRIATPTGWIADNQQPRIEKQIRVGSLQSNTPTQPRATFEYWHGSLEIPVRSRYRDYLSQDRATYNLSNPVVGPGFATSTVGFANKASGDVTASGNATSTSSPLWLVKSTTGEPNV